MAFRFVVGKYEIKRCVLDIMNKYTVRQIFGAA